ncbi:uncharacterized protein LOC126733934 [Anthonomus grandis grandis]|uniref:uncharacterized protein LOC126733934 n=1 Tax=Anthonomus grandis grandis TaxID=2921223 RepID=UPI002166766B|nr:uncharacterized protein LOC126733934 [Anthonomus grandis grandis]
MKLNIIVLVLGLAYSVQATPALEASIDVRDLIVTVYNAVLNVTGNVLEKAVEAVDYVDNSKEAIEAALLAEILNVTNSACNLQWKLLESFRNNSNTAGGTIIDCMLSEKNVSNAAVLSVANDFGSCLINGSATLGTIKEILEEWQGFVTEVQKQVTTLKNCKSLEAICLAAFEASQAVTYAKLTAALAADKVKLDAITTKIATHVLECSLKVPVAIVKDLQQPFNDIATCILG